MTARTLQEHRRRLVERGLKRLEVSAWATDAGLIRRLAKALSKNDLVSERLRVAILDVVPDTQTINFKNWLAL